MIKKTNQAKKIVSVIIPVYNVYRYVQESINSVIHQTYPYLEIIIIDDGSTDGSGEICDELTKVDDRIKVIHTENRGLSAARNTGLSVMTGCYVAFLDSDDVFVLDAIEKAIQSIENQDADIIVFGFTSQKAEGPLKKENYKKQNGRSYIPPAGIFNSHEVLRMLFHERKLVLAAWCMVYKAFLWENTTFPEGHVYEDNYVTPEIIKRARIIGMISEALIMNRRRNGSITRTNSPKNMEDQLRAHRFLIDFVRENTPEVFDTPVLERIQEDEICLQVKQFCISNDQEYKTKLRKKMIENYNNLKRVRIRPSTRIRMLGIKYVPHFSSWFMFNLVYNQQINH